jgi:hypothetical protein
MGDAFPFRIWPQLPRGDVPAVIEELNLDTTTRYRSSLAKENTTEASKERLGTPLESKGIRCRLWAGADGYPLYGRPSPGP